jgi:4'-phosphopantetheinyl transferase
MALRYFFMIWTMKEAYTKALGLGLGFDFSRLDYDIPNSVLKVNGSVPDGWEFTTFELSSESSLDSTREVYVGVVAQFSGADGSSMKHLDANSTILKRLEAGSFLKNALLQLNGT